MKRGIAILVVFSLVVFGMPLSTVPGTASSGATGAATVPQIDTVEQSSGTPETANYTTGRPVDTVTVERVDDRLSLLVSDDNPSRTPLILNRSWLRSQLGKPIEFMRFHREGELVGSYRLTEHYVIIDIPHFSTQNVTVTTVDGQFEVSGSASGQETQRVINYDVNETGIAILEIHGQGTREGEQRVDQFYSQVDNSTFQWETGEIPRNVTLEIIGQGEKLGPEFNKSHSGVSNGETVFFDLVAKDYETSVTFVGAGEKNGTIVTKGVYKNQSDGETQTLTFDFEQNNESFVAIGNTTTTNTTTVSSERSEWQNSGDWDNSTSESKVVHETYPGNDVSSSSVKLGYPTATSGLSAFMPLDEDSGSSSVRDVVNAQDGTPTNVELGQTGILSTDSVFLDGNDGDVEFPHYAALEIQDGDMAITSWVYSTNKSGSDRDPIVMKKSDDGVGDGKLEYQVSLSNDNSYCSTTNGELIFVFADSGGSIHCYQANVAPSTDAWHHIGVVYDQTNGEVEFYVDGDSVRTVSASASPRTDLNQNLQIGAHYTAGGDLDHGFDGRIEALQLYGTDISATTVSDLNDTTTSGYLETGTKTFSSSVDPSTLNLTNVSATLNSQTAEAVVRSDPDGDGTFEEESNTITFDGSGGPYEVTGLTSDSSAYRLNLTFAASSVTASSIVGEVDLKGESESTTNETVKTEDPGIDIDSDGTLEASYTGKLNDSESITLSISEDVAEGTQTWNVSTANDSTVDWKYEGNNEARAHVKNFTLNGNSYTIDTFLADGEQTNVSVDTLHTLQGENLLTLNTYADSETTHVSRVDVRGHYEGRTVVNNYTVNGQQSNLDAALADNESKSVNISSEAVYGTNNITVALKENSTQDNYDAEIVWYPENRTYFSNVTVNGNKFGSPTFLAQNETLVFNVTDAISPGDNDHVFRMQSAKTTTDTLDFVEKVEFYKNVSVTIEEKHATYNKTSTETFNHSATDVQFNFSLPDRVLRHLSTSVVYNDTQTGIQNTTTVTGDRVTVQVDEQVPNGTKVTVKINLLKFRLVNADDRLRAENPLSEPYRVDVGVTSTTGDVSYETVEADLTAKEWEIILTQNGDPYNETTEKVTFANGNVTIPESYFGNTDGLIVQRPRYSTVTYTGTVNTIYPTARIEPNRTVIHRPALYSEPDQSHVRMENYSVQDLPSPLEVEWKQVGPYHLQWVTNKSGTYNQTIENVTTEGVSVFADGNQYRDFTRQTDGDLVIHVNGSTTWDVYQYDYPTVTSDTNVSIKAGQSKTIQVAIDNPNEFTLHDVELILTHGWVESVEPQTQDIGPGETATFNVTITVPSGTEPTTYDLYGFPSLVNHSLSVSS